MSTDATPSERTPVTGEHRVAKLFGLEGDAWMRHANPLSVWTRFGVLPLLAVAIWSRDWIGWWCLVPVALSVVFMMVNPLLFPPPRSTRSWASKAVFGERIWTDRIRVTLPDQFARSRVPAVAQICQLVGVAVLVGGLIELDLFAVVIGIVFTQVLLFDDMKARRPEYADWEY